jgi:hypothetical protein
VGGVVCSIISCIFFTIISTQAFRLPFPIMVIQQQASGILQAFCDGERKMTCASSPEPIGQVPSLVERDNLSAIDTLRAVSQS